MPFSSQNMHLCHQSDTDIHSASPNSLSLSPNQHNTNPFFTYQINSDFLDLPQMCYIKGKSSNLPLQHPRIHRIEQLSSPYNQIQISDQQQYLYQSITQMKWPMILAQGLVQIQFEMYQPNDDDVDQLDIFESDRARDRNQNIPIKLTGGVKVPPLPDRPLGGEGEERPMEEIPGIYESDVEESPQPALRSVTGEQRQDESGESDQESDADDDEKLLKQIGEDVDLSKDKNNVSSYLKNFLVLQSGWMKSYIYSLDYLPSFDQIKARFDFITLTPRSTTSRNRKKTKNSRKRKVYINLKKLSVMFNDELLKPYLFNFFDRYFLRKLSVSTTGNRSCLLRFLPVLRQGLVEGKITRLR